MGADIRTEGHHAVVRGVPGSRAPRCARPTSAPARRSCWPAWWPTARRWSAGADHIDRGYEDLAGGAALARSADVACVVTAGSDRGPATRPRCSSGPSRRGPRARWRGCSRSSSGAGEADPGRGPADLPGRRRPTRSGSPGAPGAGKSTLTDRLIAMPLRLAAGRGVRREPRGAASRSTGRRPRRRPDLARSRGGAILGDRVRMQAARRSTRRSSSVRWRRGATSAACRWPCPTRCDCSGPGASRWSSSRPSASARWRSRSPVGRRHDGGRGDPRVGRLDAGQQGRPARGRRRVRHQQGGPPRRARGASRPAIRCSTCRRPAAWRPAIVETAGHDGRWGRRPVGRRGSPPGAPARLGPTDDPTGRRLSHELRRVLLARRRRSASTTWPASEEFTSAVKAPGRRRARPLPGGRPPARRMTTPPCSRRTAPATVRR